MDWCASYVATRQRPTISMQAAPVAATVIWRTTDADSWAAARSQTDHFERHIVTTCGPNLNPRPLSAGSDEYLDRVIVETTAPKAADFVDIDDVAISTTWSPVKRNTTYPPFREVYSSVRTQSLVSSPGRDDSRSSRWTLRWEVPRSAPVIQLLGEVLVTSVCASSQMGAAEPRSASRCISSAGSPAGSRSLRRGVASPVYDIGARRNEISGTGTPPTCEDVCVDTTCLSAQSDGEPIACDAPPFPSGDRYESLWCECLAHRGASTRESEQ